MSAVLLAAASTSTACCQFAAFTAAESLSIVSQPRRISSLVWCFYGSYELMQRGGSSLFIYFALNIADSKLSWTAVLSYWLRCSQPLVLLSKVGSCIGHKVGCVATPVSDVDIVLQGVNMASNLAITFFDSRLVQLNGQAVCLTVTQTLTPHIAYYSKCAARPAPSTLPSTAPSQLTVQPLEYIPTRPSSHRDML